MVQKARSGHHKLSEYYSEKLEELREKSKELKNVLPQDKEMSEEDKARFYSNWYYSGIRLLSGIKGQQEISKIAERFNLPTELVTEVVDFLVDKGLCKQENDLIKMSQHGFT